MASQSAHGNGEGTDSRVRRKGGRPPSDLVDLVAARAHTTPHSVRSFFSRPWRLSAELRQAIGEAAAHHGYRPKSPRSRTLGGMSVGFEVPRPWSEWEVPPVFAAQWLALTGELERRGGHLVPFIVEPRVENVADVVAGSAQQRHEGTAVAHQAWLTDYATALAPRIYLDTMRARRLSGFVVADPRRDDPRLAALRDAAVPYVVLGRPESDTAGPYVETDNDWGIREMIRLHLGAGCRRFAHFGFTGDRSITPERRARAIRAELGRPVPRLQKDYESRPSDDLDRSLVQWLRAEQPDAVVCDSDEYAALVARVAPEAGRRVSRRRDAEEALLLMGNDDAPVRRLAAVPWTSLRPPNATMAEATTSLLVEVLAGGAAESRLIKPTVVDPPFPS